MNIIKQIGIEIKNLLRTKFILIIGIFVLLIGIAFPLLTFGFEKFENEDNYYGYGYATMSTGEMETYEYNGIEIGTDNPFYSEIAYYEQNLSEMMVGMTYSDYFMSVFNGLTDEYLEFYMMYASEITTYDDYRMDVVYQANTRIVELFVLQADVENKEEFKEAVQYVTYIEDLDELLALSDEEKAVKIEENEAFLDKVEEAVFENDLNAYCDCMIELERLSVESYEQQIAVQEAAAIENPDLEESASTEIERLEQEIAEIQDTTIPNWEYRKEHQLYPNADDWRNRALSELQSGNYSLSNAQNPMTEEEFNNDYYSKDTYGDYDSYLEAMERQEVKAKENIAIAQNSLDADQPDMKFANTEARYMVNTNLFYALVVAFFGILLGGYIIANEFQSGTIRLLMIRPRTRTKVYIAKFFGGLSVAYGIYFLGMFANIIVNGILWGFGDYLIPNFTATGPISFWPMIIGRILVCSTTIVLSYSLAYGLSALIKNSAIAIALPGACIFGSVIACGVLVYTRFATLLAFTPLPYIYFANLYSTYGTANRLIELGAKVNAGIGVTMLLGLSLICFVVGLVHFQKHDITN